MERIGDELHAVCGVRPTMWTPGTECPRIAVAAGWADTLLGLHAVRAFAPRIPVTLELDAHLSGAAEGVETVRLASRVVRAGKTVVVATMDVTDERGRPVGFAGASFMAASDSRVLPSFDEILERFDRRRPVLEVPLAERIGCERIGPGAAVLPRTPAVYNGTRAINGGLMTLAIEEAALSADPGARRIESVHVRYVRSVRTGPAVARADVDQGTGRVEVRDASTDAIAAVATTRSAPHRVACS